MREDACKLYGTGRKRGFDCTDAGIKHLHPDVLIRGSGAVLFEIGERVEHHDRGICLGVLNVGLFSIIPLIGIVVESFAIAAIERSWRLSGHVPR